MHLTNLNKIAMFAAATMMTLACSTSTFQAAKTKSATKSAGESDTNAAGSSNAGDAGANSGGVVGGSDGSANGGSAFDNSFAAVSAEDQKVVGCTLPKNVADMMLGTVEASSLALSGWSGAGNATSSLKNLNLNNCQWFTKAKAAGVAKYMITYLDNAKQQHYAQPYIGAANPVAFAACLAQGAAMSAAAGGPITCQFMPF